MNTGPATSRLEKERARKQASEPVSLLLKKRRQTKNRERNMLHRVSESEAQRWQLLAAGQQREADRRASESEDQRLQCLAACQQRVANHRTFESEDQRLQRNYC